MISISLVLALTATPGGDDVNQFVEAARARMSVPGLAACAVSKAGLAAGYAGEVKPSSRLAVGSISKSFTGVLIGRLVEQKKLRWDQTLVESLPKVAIRDEYRDVTLADLLRHRGGFGGETGSYPKALNFSLPYAELRVRYAELMLSAAPEYPPRSKSAYANTNFVLAAIVAEQTTRKTYAELIVSEIAEPLGLKTLKIGPTDSSDTIIPHTGSKQAWKPVTPGPWAGNHPALFGADGVRLSLEDFARYAQALATEDTRLLKAATWKEVHRADDDRMACGVIQAGPFPWGGSGFWHNGSNTMNYASMTLDRANGRAVVAFTNAMGDETMNDLELFADSFGVREFGTAKPTDRGR